jgi:hypothetical protein
MLCPRWWIQFRNPGALSGTLAPGLGLTAANAALGNTDSARISCGFNHLNR